MYLPTNAPTVRSYVWSWGPAPLPSTHRVARSLPSSLRLTLDSQAVPGRKGLAAGNPQQGSRVKSLERGVVFRGGGVFAHATVHLPLGTSLNTFRDGELRMNAHAIVAFLVAPYVSQNARLRMRRLTVWKRVEVEVEGGSRCISAQYV